MDKPRDGGRRQFLKVLALGAVAGLGAYAVGSIPGLSSVLRDGDGTLVESQGICLHDMPVGIEGSLVPRAAWLRADIGSPGWKSISAYASGTGRKLLGILDQFTLWGAGIGADIFSLDDWKSAVSYAVKDNPQVAAFEVWNEPLQNTSGYQNGTPENYMNMLKTAYAAVKENAPGASVLAGGGLQAYGPYAAASLEFARTLTKLGMSAYSDAVSMHAYPYGTAGKDVVQAYESSVRSFAEITGKEIWISETGQITAYGQESYITSALPALERGGASKVFWYELADGPGGEFGLLSASLRRKPAYYAYVDELGTLMRG